MLNWSVLSLIPATQTLSVAAYNRTPSLSNLQQEATEPFSDSGKLSGLEERIARLFILYGPSKELLHRALSPRALSDLTSLCFAVNPESLYCDVRW